MGGVHSIPPCRHRHAPPVERAEHARSSYRRAFTTSGTAVPLPPESLFHFLRIPCSTSRIRCSTSSGIAVPLPPDSVFHFLRNTHDDGCRRGGQRTLPPLRAVGSLRQSAMRRSPSGYPARAPSANAMCRHAARSGVARGRRRTMRRTEHTTWTPSFSSRSRSQGTLPSVLSETRQQQGALAPRELPRLNTVGSEEARPAGAGLRPPLKRYVRFSRIPLSRRRLRVMRTDGGIKEWNPPPARRVQPVGKSPRSLMLGSFTHGTVHLSALAHLTVLSGPDRLRRPPSPTHSVAAP